MDNASMLFLMQLLLLYLLSINHHNIMHIVGAFAASEEPKVFDLRDSGGTTVAKRPNDYDEATSTDNSAANGDNDEDEDDEHSTTIQGNRKSSSAKFYTQKKSFFNLIC